MKRLFWLMVGLVGCMVQAEDGTAVGNPTMDAQMARVQGATTSTGRLPVDRVVFTGCDGTTVVEEPGNLDLVGADPLPMPDIPVCRIDVIPRYNLELSGTTLAGGGLQVALALPPLTVSIPAGVSNRHLVLELGAPGWLDVSAEAGGVTIAPGSPTHDALVAAVVAGTSLFDDADSDGQVDDEEREDAPETEVEDGEDSDVPEDTDSDDPADDTDAGDTDAGDTDAGDTDAGDTDS